MVRSEFDGGDCELRCSIEGVGRGRYVYCSEHVGAVSSDALVTRPFHLH